MKKKILEVASEVKKIKLDPFGKKRRIIVLVIVLTFLSIGFAVHIKRAPQEKNLVRLTKDGFRPEVLEIKKGETVKFVSELEEPFWPASNIHPTHDIFSEFDPKRPIKPGESWEFKFEKVGEWGYHDHLLPKMTGKIIVQGEGVLSSQEEKCRNPKELSYNERQTCWYFEMKEIIEKEGLEGAFGRLTQLYEDEVGFQSGCHDVTHLIGDEAYHMFARGEDFDFTEKTSYCGYGFYHGFIEAILFGGGTYEEAQSFCEEVGEKLEGIKNPLATYSCYHGMGHAMFDQHDPRLWGDEAKMAYPALDICEKITKGKEEEKRKQCATGIFNALGIAYSNDQYGLELEEKDPVWFCREQKELYKKPCFAEVSIAWIYTSMGADEYKFDEAKSYIESMNDVAGEEVGMFVLSSDYVRVNRETFEVVDMVDKCQGTKVSLRDDCVRGVALALMGWSKPGEEYKETLRFCRAEGLSKGEKDACMNYFLPRVGTMYSSEKTASICSQIEEEYRSLCH